MWNTINNNLLFMGNNKQLFGPNSYQKRHFGYDFPSVGNIVVGKSFNNPNFVNKDHPKIHHYQTNHSVSQSGCHIDSDKAVKSFAIDAPFINSSQSITEAIREKHLDIFQPVDNTDHLLQTANEPLEDKLTMCKKRTRKSKTRSRKAKLLKNPDKSLKNKIQDINVMMEIDFEPQEYSKISEMYMSTKDHNSLTLSDFLCNNTSIETDESDNLEMDEEGVDINSFAFISNSPSMACRFKRERTLSTAESEDSFIVFESGTDDELEFSDDTQEEDESEDDTDEDDLDSSPTVVPRKKVGTIKKDWYLFS